jgi:hypothetical protein
MASKVRQGKARRKATGMKAQGKRHRTDGPGTKQQAQASRNKASGRNRQLID